MAPRRWPLGSAVTTGYCIAAAAILVSAAAVYQQTLAMRAAADRVHRTQLVVHQIDRVELEMLNAETGQRGYLLTGETRYLEPYEQGRAAFAETLEVLKRRTADSPAQQARIAQLQQLGEQKLGELRTTIELRQRGQTEAALAIVQQNRGAQLMDQIRSALQHMQREEESRLEWEIGQRNIRSRWAGPLSVLSSALALLVVGLSTFAANRATRRRIAVEQTLREAEERLRVTMRSIGDAVIATDLEGRVTFINYVAVNLTGWPIAEARGRALMEVFRIINEHTRVPVESPVERVLREGTVVGLANHTMLLPRHGGEIPIEDSGAPIRDAAGAVMGVVLVFRDASDRRRQEEERERLHREEHARAEAERASAIKDEFLAILSHELRSPLQGVLGWVTLLRQTGSDPTQQRALQAIERGVRQQAQLVNDILDVSRVATGKLQIQRERVDISRVVEECVDETVPVARERGIQLQTLVRDCGAVIGDHRRLRQCVTNLLGNAVKFTPSGGRIDVRCEQDDGATVLTISDSGEGIAPEVLPHIFERFRQAETQGRYSTSGLGLGLSLVKQIVELHGGTVQAASAGPGRGATFTVRLPMAAAGAAAAPSTRSSAGAAPTLRGLTILVVDDDDDTRESLTTLLTLRGAEVDQAESSGAAIAAYARRVPDVIVSDISMPGQDGYQLLATLRARPHPGPRPPAIALTGLAGPDERARTTAAGFDAHVAKPIDLDTLIQTVLELVSPRRQAAHS